MEEYDSGAGRNGRSRYKDQFIDSVFSRCISDIFDEGLNKNQVEDIAETFESVDHYLGSFANPLLEETRAELASAMDTLNKAPFAVITSLAESKHGTYNVKVGHWKNRQSDCAKEAYKTLPGDIVLVSNMKPVTASDLKRAGCTFNLAYVKCILEDADSRTISFNSFNVKTAKTVEAGDWRSQARYVVYLMNVTTHKRMWDGLQMRQNMRIIGKVLSKDDLGEENCEHCPLQCSSEIKEMIDPTLLSKLNESQLEAILTSLSKTDCHHKPSVQLIWGPPGTGKTTTVSILLYTLLRMNVRTVVCAPTNVAIRQLAARVLALVRKSDKTESETGLLSHPLGGMLIFGSNDRLKVDSDIEEIFLDYRVDRLVECLALLTGWKQCVSSMLDFLEDCVSQHQIFVENERIKAKEMQSKPKSLLEFARDRFSHLAPPLRKCMMTILTHFPRSCIHDQTCKIIKQLMLHLGYIETLLFEDNCSMTCDELERVFLKKKITSGFEIFAGSSSLKNVRNECLSILGSLQTSLNGLDLPTIRTPNDKAPVTEFCFQKASLIFCTTSSSFKILNDDMKPFSLLVIDEAAQVKECESIIPLQIPDVRHAILVGDEKQLPAIVNSKLSKGAGFGRSLFARLSSMGHSKHLLNVQYRMHPSISRFPNSNFYLNQILDAPSVQTQSYEKRYLQGTMFGPYSFINVRDGDESSDGAGRRSKINMTEVDLVVKLVQKLFIAWNASNENLSIGLISPYAAQVAAIRHRLQQKYDNHKGFVVNVKSVDGFQGGEEDVIIISTVRSNKRGSIGFLDSLQRTNVVLTRARHCLWILGNERTLSRSDSVWKAIVCDAKRRKCFFNADDDRGGKAIIVVKKELEQLADHLSGVCILFRNSRWKVLLSKNFIKSFQKLKPSNVKKLVINKLLKLASGWGPKNMKVDRTCESSAYIVKQLKVKKYYVVCSVDIIIKDSTYLQVLKVWDILPIAETPELLKRLDGIFAIYTDDFINQCNTKLLERNLEIPKSWSTSNDLIRFKNSNNTASSSTIRSDGAADLREYERVGNIYLECCGGSELRKAGECFLDECLSACTKGNYVDISLQYIEQWKQQASLSSGVVTKVNEIEKTAQDFLEKIALECRREKDNASLMKFVRAFNTIESKRNFLKSLDCVEELLILEEESGNFNEAAGIVKRLGDTLHKVDLLETSGDYTNASLLVISYVLCNSLWLSGRNNQGWPLKAFPQKDELLTKAKLFAHKVSRSFHLSICAEANAVMTHEHMKLSELMEFYSASKEYNTYMGEILSVRKLLDAHLQVNLTEYEWDLELHTGPVLFNERISKNKVSCRTLTYVWYLWKVKILEILDCLDSLENRFEGIVRFCHDYFGVRLTNNPSATYILLKPDAVWVRTVKKFIVRNKKMAILDARHFSSAAQKYLRQELVSTGFRVLEALHRLSVTKPLSKYCQSLCLFCVYDVTRFFIESKSLVIKKVDDLKLKDFLKLSTTKYFELVFPLDPRNLSEKLVLSRETEMSRNLLDEIISRNVHGTQNELTFGQIGRVVMIMLGSGKPKHELYVRIVEKLGANSPWKQLVANLFSVTFSVDLSRVLQETYNTNWRGKIDYISPNCFFYLVERLLILVPHPQGYFFTTKSSFVEHLMCQQLDAEPSDTFVIDDKLYPQNLVDFLVDVVHQCLHNTRETMEWIQNSRIDGKYYFPIIMLRLIVILCTLCLNSYVPFDVLFQMLETPQIRSQLPTEFYEAFSRINKNKDSSYVSATAGAFEVIGDPLVIVSLTGARPKDVAPDAVCVDLRLFSCRNEIVNVLFRPEKIEDSSAAANGNNVREQEKGENRLMSKFTIKASSVCCASFFLFITLVGYKLRKR